MTLALKSRQLRLHGRGTRGTEGWREPGREDGRAHTCSRESQQGQCYPGVDLSTAGAGSTDIQKNL